MSDKATRRLNCTACGRAPLKRLSPEPHKIGDPCLFVSLCAPEDDPKRKCGGVLMSWEDDPAIDSATIESDKTHPTSDQHAAVHAAMAKNATGTNDPVNKPAHYTTHPSGVECIQVTEHMGFCLGNVVKYLWRADQKGAPIEDLKKAAWYLAREIQRREKL